MKINDKFIDKNTVDRRIFNDIYFTNDVSEEDIYIGTKVVSHEDYNHIMKYYISKFHELFIKTNDDFYLSLSDYGNLVKIINKDFFTIDDFRMYLDSDGIVTKIYEGDGTPDYSGNWIYNITPLTQTDYRFLNYRGLKNFMKVINARDYKVINDEMSRIYGKDTKSENYTIAGNIYFEPTLKLINKPIKR